MENRKFEESYYFGYASDELRKKSSSGGIFGALAQKTIEDGGIVFGAIFDATTQRIVYSNSDEVDLFKLMRSKYVQADLGNSFSLVENNLENHRKVLFAGTPCYVAGLKNYIQFKCPEFLENLILVDFLCEGVPSPKVFTEYQKYLEKKYKSTIKDISFRSKKYGWRLHCMNVHFESQKEYTKIWWDDLYMQAFLREMILNRPCCYQCKFREDKVSDITLGDFWAIERYDSRFVDNRGTSIVTVRTEKGQKFFDTIQFDGVYNLPANKISLAHQDLSKTGSYIHRRNMFYKDLEHMSFEEAAKKYCELSDRSLRVFLFKLKMIKEYRVRIPCLNYLKYLFHKMGIKRKMI